ncbi:MAG: LuxR C-terminal-related transcriptional regulator, partial [Actinomycetota bacterium]|nr:LuxR C-terminal-related transcriptional regulator [Actinomycetota bacterium]
AEAAMSGSAQEAWVGRLEVEHDNLRAALDWSEEEAGGAEAGLRLAAALERFWWIRGHFTEGLARLESILALPGGLEPSMVRAKACHALGMVRYRRGDQARGDLDKARVRFEESLEIYRKLGNEPRIAEALRDQGRVGIELGEYASACSLLEESLKLQRRLGNKHGIALTLYGLGWLDLFRGEHAPAQRALEGSLALLRTLGDTFSLGACLYYLGCLACERGDFIEARSRFLEIAEKTPLQQYRWGAPFVLEGFACVAAAQDQAARALRLAGVAAKLRQVMGARLGPGSQRYLARRLEPARQALGEEEATAAWAEGEKMTLEQAFVYALEEEPTTSGQEAEDQPERPVGTSLSARELEVLGLVAEGLTDAQVAQRLHLSPRTVGRHLEGVYRKLGVSSRTAAVRTAGELGLL